MDKILLVDDNKALSKLLAKKMNKELPDMQVDVAHSFEEAKILMAKNKKDYFLAVLDLNLPDAPNGEIVDYALAGGLGVIVLTGSLDKKTKEFFTQKEIIDYVYKGNVDDVNYIFSTINRLSKNRKFKVMVVDDSSQFRSYLKKVMKNLQFQVFTAAHGEEAMNYFNDNPDIKLVLTDYNMPVKNGLEVLREIRAEHGKNDVGVIVMTSPNEDVGAPIFIKQGANDFIAKPFEKEELICRVNNTIDIIENIEQIANFANHDFLTGIYNRRFFYENVAEYSQKAHECQESFAIAMIDIDHFKSINDTFGHDGGDRVLKSLASQFTNATKGSDIVARFGGEEFCILLKNVKKEDAIKFFVKLRADIAASQIEIKGSFLKFTISIGLAFSNEDYTLDELLELADNALYVAKESGRNRVEVANYDY
ncbi:GGDEF domain-containing response regulator [Campylobacter gastrosuis]|uniref:diguanylate cyclase n=1 Tax=Campylobacter gastrosuis TaxID=2974576 RepID=A0ABT7HQR3_9BACT|nr:diguanylate cyclase [Campylobacter gastrosuis]MDL0089203.1 diguanylate cyclase [Campylobacter gastrosuis]